MYSIRAHFQTIAQHQSWHFKDVKKCLLVYNASAPAEVGPKTSLPKAYNLLWSEICKDNENDTITVRNLNGDISADLNRLHANNVSRGILERKKFDPVHSVFPIVAAFNDREYGENHCHLMTHVHMNFSELQRLLNCEPMEHLLAPSIRTQSSTLLKTSVHS